MDFMSTQDASSLSSSPFSSTPRWTYDVFLSFRGKDTRYGFTDHLYNALIQNGIFTFRDDEELETGKPISQELLKVIEESRFAVVILSKNYASSTWCLDELAEIVRCMKENEMIVVPVFYHVNPSNVRDQRGTFEEAFTEHEAACNIQKVETWRAALREVANISGWPVEERQYESKEIREIVGHILHRLSSTFSSITKNLVGIESPMTELVTLYLRHGNNTCMIGICGMGGLGKTTLARVIYERVHNHFEGSSFIANVGEVSKNHGLNRLQKQLLEQILLVRNIDIWNVYEGVNMIKNRLRRKKVLVVLDDVNHLDQLENLVGHHGWFGAGSWIIITTRNEHLLDQHGVQKYKQNALNGHDALKLFSLKALKNEQSKEGYMQLSQDVLYYAKGLPIALVTLGSYLVGRTMNEWQSALESLKNFPRSEIIDVLKISYDGLEEMEKEIFLDIACFFNGETKDRVIKILENCGFHARIGIRVLKDKSLLTIEEGQLWMHDLLQEMGKEIVRRESRGEPGKRSRLWLLEDLLHVLTKDTATEAIQAIVLNSYEWEELIGYSESFAEFFSKICNLRSKMCHLRLIIIPYVDIPRALCHSWNYLSCYPTKEVIELWLPTIQYVDIPSALCHSCNYLRYYPPKELIELSLPTIQIKYLLEGVKCLDKLKCIDLSDSLFLIQVHDFTGIPMLERLYLSGCRNLIVIHPSIGQLRRLVVLDLAECASLTNLPTMTTEMQALKILNLYGCSKIKKIPEFMGTMKSLSELDLCGTAIKKLPSSIMRLTTLTILNLKGCKNLECLPSNIDSLSSLKKLFLSRCSKLANLPENFWKIKCLKELELSCMSGLKGIGFNGIGCLYSLKHLTLSGNSFVTLPASICQLSKLEALDLCSCYKLQSLPELPSTVRYINAQNCYSLEPSPALRRLSMSVLQPCSELRLYDESRGKVAFTILYHYLQGLLCRKTGNETSDRTGTEFQMIIPGFAIQQWFTHQKLGNSVIIELPPNWCNSGWMGFALSASFDAFGSLEKNSSFDAFGSLEKRSPVDKILGLRAYVRALGDMPHSLYTSKIFFGVTPGMGHIWLLFLSRDSWFATVHNGECSQIEVVFEDYGPRLNVQKCGVRLVYEQDVEEFNQTIAQCDSSRIITYKGWDGVHHEFDNSSSSYSDTECDVYTCSSFEFDLSFFDEWFL